MDRGSDRGGDARDMRLRGGGGGDIVVVLQGTEEY